MNLIIDIIKNCIAIIIDINMIINSGLNYIVNIIEE